MDRIQTRTGKTCKFPLQRGETGGEERKLSDESFRTYAAVFTTSKAFLETDVNRNGMDFYVCSKPAWLQPGFLDKQKMNSAPCIMSM